MRIFTVAALILVFVSTAAAQGIAARRESRPAPRWPDGTINLGAPLGESGKWEGQEPLATDPNHYENRTPGRRIREGRIHIDQVPLQPWARAIVKMRHDRYLADEPYTRCKPAGGPRQFMSPYGLEIVEMPELKLMFIFNISNAMSYRRIYMDGRSHPKNIAPTYLGHSVGRWEGDTLVIDSVGFSENAWMNRDGLPHTSQLRLVERLTRTNFETLNYEVTIDDPAAYTAPWTSGYTLGWSKGLQLFEYVCQENNISPESMGGDALTSAIVP